MTSPGQGEGGSQENPKNGDIYCLPGGRGSENGGFCGDVIFEWPLSDRDHPTRNRMRVQIRTKNDCLRISSKIRF